MQGHLVVVTKSHIPMNKVLHLIYCWAQRYPCTMAEHEAHVSTVIVTNFYQRFRQEANYWLQDEGQQPIGGEGLNVEIDESISAKRKNNTGRVLQEIWVFRRVCRETHEQFVFEVLNRKSRTLLPIIQHMILPGSIIHTDGWKAYNNIPTLSGRYTHMVVNHSRNFINPQTGAHTQTVERMWREVKRIRRMYEGVQRNEVSFHLAEYLWREVKSVTYKNAFEKQ